MKSTAMTTAKDGVYDSGSLNLQIRQKQQKRRNGNGNGEGVNKDNGGDGYWDGRATRVTQIWREIDR